MSAPATFLEALAHLENGVQDGNGFINHFIRYELLNTVFSVVQMVHFTLK